MIRSVYHGANTRERYVHGMYAFALVETEQYEQAEIVRELELVGNHREGERFFSTQRHCAIVVRQGRSVIGRRSMGATCRVSRVRLHGTDRSWRLVDGEPLELVERMQQLHVHAQLVALGAVLSRSRAVVRCAEALRRARVGRVQGLLRGPDGRHVLVVAMRVASGRRR